MPDLNTDSKLMRRHQDKDTPEEITEDETRPGVTKHDADAESGADREAAKDGTATYDAEQMEAIFERNNGTGRVAENTAKPSPDERENAHDKGLADAGRSKLRR